MRPAARRPVRRLVRGFVRAAACAALAAAAGGCASAARAFARPFAVAPSGLEVPEQRLRDALAGGRWEAALRQAGRERDGGPSDALLRELYRGTAAYYGARWDEGALAFQRAAASADDRYTKRVSRGALALATNDRALPYVPGDNERLFAHYYAALGYLHAGDLNGAAVEARRLAYRLQQADARRDPLDASARAALRYFTGAVFEAAGDREDAAVAYRNAAALGARVDTGAQRRPPAALAGGHGDVVVLVEEGFVAHRVNERLSVRLGDSAAERLTLSTGGVVVDGRGGRAAGAWDPAPGTLGARLAALLTGDQGLWAGDLPPTLALETAAADSGASGVVGVPARGVGDVARGPVDVGASAGAAGRGARAGREPRPGRARRDADDGGAPWGRTFTVAWPAYRRAAGWGRTAAVFADAAAAGIPAPAATSGAAPRGATAGGAGVGTLGATALPAVVRGDLSLAAAGDFKRDRGKVLARLVTRAALRAALAREAGRTGRGLDDVVRVVTNATEQADTRSWHLLPGAVQVLRARMPAGAHALVVEAGGRRVALGTVRVAPGGVRFVSARVWEGGRVTAFGTEGAR